MFRGCQLAAQTTFVIPGRATTAGGGAAFQSMVVINVPELRCGPDLPAAQPGRGDGVSVLQDPGGLVEVVDVLLDDVVAGEPGEVVPVAHLPFHVGHFRLALDTPERAGVVARV